MAARTSATFAKRQKERARQEKQQAKLQRKLERRNQKSEPDAGPEADSFGAETEVPQPSEAFSTEGTVAPEAAITQKEIK
ncbi:MAG: hypothetical protein WB524_14655 [Acidobacteriaceae bacterium]